MTARLHIGSLLLLCVLGACVSAAENLAKNPGFEDSLEPAWHKRTPDDAKRKICITSDAVHSGKCSVVLENIEKEYTRLRQGQDKSIAVAPGSLVELTVWVKSDLNDEGRVIVQLYCMGDGDKIMGSFTAKPIIGKFDWTELRCLAQIPDGTTYVMPYLEIKDAVGKAYFDDVALHVLRGPRPRTPVPRVAVITDLPDDDPCYVNLKVLLGDGLVPVREGAAEKQLSDCAGAAVLWKSDVLPKALLDAVVRFAEEGHPVFMDIRNLAQWRGIKTVSIAIGPTDEKPEKLPVEERMAIGLRVVKESDATSGFAEGQTIPRMGADGTLLVIPKGAQVDGMEILAVGPGGEAGLVRMASGKGSVVASDVLSLREPYYTHVDAYYKYLFLTNTLTSRVQFGEYYLKRYPYDEFVGLMKGVASEFPQVRFQEEGPACGDYKICSLNIGKEGAPMYFMYAACHGSEWEPGYGLLTFVKHVARGRMKDVIDLDKASIKIVPILNPSGYDKFTRKNANEVDLNRQGDYRWQEFVGMPKEKGGEYGPNSQHWKGIAPFAEPEAQTYRKICLAANLYCVLDFHGNASAKNNKLGILPIEAKGDNDVRGFDMQYIINERLRGRFVIKQIDEDTFSQYVIDRVYRGGPSPFLYNTSTRDRYGILFELTAGYRSSYGTVLQTDVTCEICRALFIAYPPPK
ncbi:MAG: M14 family zinc carboxypeptidase [Planctomycetota bacterium]